MKRILFELLFTIQCIALLTALPGVMVSGLIDRITGKETQSKWRLP